MSLAGRLEDIALADIIQILSIGKKTGALTIYGDRGSALIVFNNGLIVKAETDAIEGNIGLDLVRCGLVKEHVLDMAIEVKKNLPGKSLAEILLDLGSINKDLLDKAAKKRIEKVISRIIAVNSGDFRFDPDTFAIPNFDGADAGWELSKGLSAQYLLMEGARVYDEQIGRQQGMQDLSEEEFEEEVWGDEEELPHASNRKDMFALKSLTQELRFPSSTSEITLLILRFASDIFERGVLFMVGDHKLAGLGQFGLDIEGADEKIRETIIAYKESSFLKKIIGGGQPYKGSLERDAFTQVLLKEIGDRWPSEVAFFPIIAENKVVALLYCDNSASGQSLIETEGLEIFIDQAGLALEKSLLQKKLQEMQKALKS
jgi:Domain of unknown function (DUF4388)